MHDDDDLSTLNHQYIPKKVWDIVLGSLRTTDRDDFYKFCSKHHDIPCSKKEREWIKYARSNPDPKELAHKIIDQATTYNVLRCILQVSRRANPQLRKESDLSHVYGQNVAYYLISYFYSKREYQLIERYLPSINHDQAKEIVLNHFVRSDEMEFTGFLIRKYQLEADISLLLATKDLPLDKVKYYFDENLVKVKYPSVMSLLAIKHHAIFFLIMLSEQNPDVVKSAIEEIGIEKFYQSLTMRCNYLIYREYFLQWYEKLFKYIPVEKDDIIQF